MNYLICWNKRQHKGVKTWNNCRGPERHTMMEAQSYQQLTCCTTHHYRVNLDGLTWIVTWICKTVKKDQIVECIGKHTKMTQVERRGRNYEHQHHPDDASGGLRMLVTGHILPSWQIKPPTSEGWAEREQRLQSLHIYYFDCTQNIQITITVIWPLIILWLHL